MQPSRTARDSILWTLLASVGLMLGAMASAAFWPSFANTLSHASLWILGFEGFCGALFRLATVRIRRPNRSGLWILALLISQSILLGVLLLLERRGGGFVFGYPEATAWFLYVFWPSQALFLLFFAWPYARWFHTDEDARRIERLIEEHGVSRGRRNA